MNSVSRVLMLKVNLFQFFFNLQYPATVMNRRKEIAINEYFVLWGCEIKKYGYQAL
jgi:hypothetical protein